MTALRRLSLIAFLAVACSAARPEASEALRAPDAGGGSSAVSLAPGPSQDGPGFPPGMPAAVRIPSTGAPVSMPVTLGAIGTALIGGWASWYEDPRHPRGYYAAAGPLLREALGDWRGQYVTVEAGKRSVTLVLSDACACGPRHGKPTLLDLSRDAFAELADPSVGIVIVSIELDTDPDPRDDAMRLEDRELPQTDQETP